MFNLNDTLCNILCPDRKDMRKGELFAVWSGTWKMNREIKSGYVSIFIGFQPQDVAKFIFWKDELII